MWTMGRNFNKITAAHDKTSLSKNNAYLGTFKFFIDIVVKLEPPSFRHCLSSYTTLRSSKSLSKLYKFLCGTICKQLVSLKKVIH